MKRTSPSPLTLADVNLHRTALYGFAALWILINHTDAPLTGALGYVLNGVRLLGACGVEIFVLLSGAGLYRSLERDPDVLHFYKKRLQRVFLPGFIVALLYYSMHFDRTGEFLLKITFLGFWLGKPSYWYVPFILLMYLVYPALYRLQKRRPKALWQLFGLSVAVALVACCFDTHWTRTCLVAVVRVPAFLLGCILAPKFHADAPVSRRTWLLLPAAVLLLVPTAMLPWPYFGFTRMLAYLCLGWFMIFALTRVFDLLSGSRPGRVAYRFFAFYGGCSLELYLIFERLLRTLKPALEGVSLLKLDLIALMMTMLLAPLLTRLCRTLVQAYESTKVPEKNPE